jgi:hypothetical protein
MPRSVIVISMTVLEPSQAEEKKGNHGRFVGLVGLDIVAIPLHAAMTIFLARQCQHIIYSAQ